MTMTYGHVICLQCFHSYSGPLLGGWCSECRGEMVLSPWGEELAEPVVHAAILAIAGVGYVCERVGNETIRIEHLDPIALSAQGA